MDPRIGEVYLSREELRTRVGELGAQIAADYTDREPVLVTILKGAFVFLADLSRAVPIPHALDFATGLAETLQDRGKDIDLFVYEGAGHLLTGSDRDLFLQRTIALFRQALGLEEGGR